MASDTEETPPWYGNQENYYVDQGGYRICQGGSGIPLGYTEERDAAFVTDDEPASEYLGYPANVPSSLETPYSSTGRPLTTSAISQVSTNEDSGHFSSEIFSPTSYSTANTAAQASDGVDYQDPGLKLAELSLESEGPSDFDLTVAVPATGETSSGIPIHAELKPKSALRPSFLERSLNEARRFFVYGKVFKVWWSEPAGEQSKGASIVTDHKHGERHACKIRWFVVIKTFDLHCICLPIQTYEYRGVGKKGLIKEEHAIIYTGDEPEPNPSEKPKNYEYPMKQSIRVIPSHPWAKLERMSRLNYAKAYTVEYNLKAEDFGFVDAKHHYLLYTSWNAVVNPGYSIFNQNPVDVRSDMAQIGAHSVSPNAYHQPTSQGPHLVPGYPSTFQQQMHYTGQGFPNPINPYPANLMSHNASFSGPQYMSQPTGLGSGLVQGSQYSIPQTSTSGAHSGTGKGKEHVDRSSRRSLSRTRERDEREYSKYSKSGRKEKKHHR